MKKNNIVVFIYKSFVVLGCISFILMFAIPIVASIIGLTHSSGITFCIWLCFGLLMLSGIVVLVIPFVINNADRKSIDTLFSSKKRITKESINNLKFDELLLKLNKNLILTGYEEIERYKDNQFELYVFLKSTLRVDSSFFVIIHSRELTDEILEKSDHIITSCLQRSKGVLNHRDVISMVCVDRLSHCFDKIMNLGLEQDFSTSRFIAGISFGGSKLYIAPPHHKFASLNYSKNRNRFMKCVDFIFPPINK